MRRGPVYPSRLGANAVPITSSGELLAAIDALRDRKVLRYSLTATLTLTNGSPIVTGVGTSFRADQKLRVNDLVQHANDVRYYKIKSVDTDTQYTLFEPYQGPSAGPSSQEIRTYYLDWVSFILQPGEYSIANIDGVYPGQSFTGADKHSVIINESSATPPTVFTEWGENRLSNLTIAPTDQWGVVDGLVSAATLEPRVWAGMSSAITNCVLDTMNTNLDHSGGAMRLPVLGGGRSLVAYCEIVADNPSGFSSGGALTPASTNTEVVLHHNYVRVVKGAENGSGLATPMPYVLDVSATYKIGHTTIEMEDIAVGPSSFIGGPGAIWIPPTVPDVVADIAHLSSHITNNRSAGTSVPACLRVDGPATVNLASSDLEAAGTGAQALIVTHSGATVNVRGSRIKGDTNSVNCAAGTVNVDTASTLVGATTGAGSINLGTDT